jgi:hypothetical protein
MADLDEGYVNFRFTVSLQSMRTVHADEFSCRLPPWIIKVSGVRENGTLTDGRKPLVARANKYGKYSGWQLTAANELTFYRMGQARAFDVECAKLPALMTKGTLPAQTAMATNQMRFDADPATTADYPHETIQNSYAGGLFEITGPASARVGQLLRCVGSVHDQSSTGTVLTMEEAWTSVPLVSDQYEMHMEIPDQHLNLLLMLAARRLFAQKAALKSIQAYLPELAEEYDTFMRSIATRTIQEPTYIGEGNNSLNVESEYLPT